MKKVIGIAGAVVLILGIVIVVRTLLAGRSSVEATPVEIGLDEYALAERLSEAIRFETISPNPPASIDPEPFRRYIEWLEAAYPLVHERLSLERIADLSLLYTWRGSDAEAAPILITAHYDVVPVNPESVPDWTHPPFAGEVADGYVWGRGALDDKGAMIAILEAATLLLEEGFTPGPTVYLAFGHDEEIGLSLIHI